MTHNDTKSALAKREQLEAEKMTRRAALRKMGLTTGMTLFGMFAIDDLARMTVQRLKQMDLHNEAVNAVAHDFKNVGVAFAKSPKPSRPTCAQQCASQNGTDCFEQAGYAKCVCICNSKKKSPPDGNGVANGLCDKAYKNAIQNC